MKLIHYTLRNLFVPILVIFAAWGCVFCLMILHEVEDETNDSLENYKEIIIRSALADSTLLKDHVDIMTRYYIREVPESEAKLDKDEFYDATVYIEIEQEYEPVRALRTYFMTKDRKFYELTLELSTLEQEDMIETIIWSMAVLYIALISCILFVIHRGFKRSFKPLYKLLSWLKSFQVGKYNPPLNNPTPIEEFKILNETVQESVNQSDKLYNKQRHFVENAAHELQTPLAEAERDKALAQSRSSIIERNEAVRQLQEQEADIQQADRVAQPFSPKRNPPMGSGGLYQQPRQTSERSESSITFHALPPSPLQ